MKLSDDFEQSFYLNVATKLIFSLILKPYDVFNYGLGSELNFKLNDGDDYTLIYLDEY